MEESDTPAWMVTYGDMVTLLLTFFILYYSIAAQNLMKFKEAIFGEEKNNIGLIELVDTMEIRTSLNEWTGFQKNNLLNDIEKMSSDQISLDKGPNNSRMVVRIPGRTLFKPGSADLDKAGWPALTEIANVFKKYPNYKINIQGHTDDFPISSGDFATNWELSAVRATAVLRFLNDKGIDPMHMTATGYADTFPLGPNTTPEERAKNRRVEFVLEKIK
jgi:chemotaxis protein MotB